MFVSPEKQSCACRAFLLLLMLLPGSAAAGGPRVTRELDFDWRFHLGDAAGAEAAGYDDASWRTLDLPHDWGIEGEYRPDNPDHGAGAYLPGGIGWYRRVFDVPPEWHDRRVRIEFDAAQRNSDVWINGHLLGHRPYGYISFAYDLTPHLAPGRNVIAVRLDNPLPAARWYTGSGIYSHVRLVVSDKLHVAQWGTFVTTQLAYEGDGEARVATELLNEGADRVNARLVSEVRDERDQVVAVDEHRTVVPPAGPTTRPGVARLQQSLHVERPHPWSPPSPNLYRLVQRLYRGDQLVDQVSTPFGFRSARFDPNDGFRLNGHVLKLKGVGMHYDASPTGVAIPDEVLEDRLRRLKEMGCNAIRTGHTPFPPVFYDLCDRLGLMVIDEAFDGWRKKVEHDYGAESFQQWWKQDLGDMVRRDRSHPSVILWSIGNETGTSDRLGMSEFVRQLDPTRLTTGGQCLLGVGVAGFNGPGEVPGVLEKFHREHADVPVVLTEETHAYQTRGFYRTVTNYRESDPDKLTPFEPYTTREIFAGDGDPQYRSSYDNAPVRMTSRQCWRRTRDTPWISGEFRWAAFDYLGEAHFSGRHWPMRFGNPGIFDASGIPKDTAFFYQSQWSDQPVVHLLPHWTHPLLAPGTVIPVVAYSNCEEVEVFLNGRSLGRKTPRAELLDFVWQVPYEPGEVKAIGYRAGRAVGEAQFRTAGAPAGLKLEWPGPELKADRRDVATVTFSVCDERGVTVPWSMDRVEFALSGPARLLGYENGNPTDVTPHRVPHRDAFYGFGRGFFQATDQDGPIELTAAAILGDRSLRTSTTAAMAVQRLSLRGPLAPATFAIHYTTDGSEPTAASPVYQRPVSLSGATTVRMLVVRDGKPALTSRAVFEPGPSATPATAPAAQPLVEPFDPRPRDKELVGLWHEGERQFRFAADGRVFRRRGGGETDVARWWFDYPDDVFEDEKTTGKGQLRWNDSGEVAELRLDDRQATALTILGKERTRRLVKTSQP